jgi:hypothetical protein
MTDKKRRFLWLGAGSLLFAFVGWKWNMALAAWVGPVFLVRYFRSCGRWRCALLAHPALVAASFLKFSGTWAYRGFFRRAPVWSSALLLPAGYVLCDFAFARIPSFGTAGRQDRVLVRSQPVRVRG